MDERAYAQREVSEAADSFSPKSLSEACQNISTPSTAYGSSDIPVTYASVASFNNFPVTYEPSMPTPVSLAGSPSLPERGGKMIHPHGQHGRRSQQPTPPETSRAWDYQTDVPVSHTGSPIEGPTTTADMLNYPPLESSNSPVDQGSINMPQPQFHWGDYTVSSTEPQDDIATGLTHHPTFPMQTPSVAPSALIRHPVPPHTGPNVVHGLALSPHASHVHLLSQAPDPRNYSPGMTMTQLSHYGNLNHMPHVEINFDPSYGPRRTSRTSANGRGRAGRGPRKARPSSRGINGNSSSSTGANAGTSPAKKLIALKDTATENQKLLFDVRCRLNDIKGKGMWDAIEKAWRDLRPQEKLKDASALQMRVKRIVFEHAEWPSSEDEALIRAEAELNRRRPSDILTLMKEYGGCEAWDWKPEHIAKRLVELQIDQFEDDGPDMKPPRRQRKNAVRGKSTVGNAETLSDPSTDVAPNNRRKTRPLSSAQEEFLYGTYSKQSSNTPEPEAMQGVVESRPQSHQALAPATREVGNNPSLRVARQACDQMLSRRENEQCYPPYHHTG